MNPSPFLLFLGARACMSLSATMLSVAVGWHLYALTGDPFDLALVGLVQVTPALLFFILTGMLVDHLPRKQVLIFCAIMGGALVATLAYVMQGDLGSTRPIFILLFLNATVLSLFKPASDSILPSLLSVDRLQSGIALSATTTNIAMTSGPFVAGFLLLWLDKGVYWCMSALMLVAAISLMFLPRITHLKPSGRGLGQLLGGLAFIKRSPVVLASISLDLFIVLFGSVIAMLPVYAADILEVGPDALGLMRGMPALGAVAMGFAMARLPELHRVGEKLFLALFVFAASILLFAFSTVLWLSLLALFLYGASDMVSVNVRSTLLLLATPEPLRGRVTAVNSLFITASNQVGDFRAGSVASILSPVVTVTLGGLCAMFIALGGYYVCRSIRSLDRMSEVRAE